MDQGAYKALALTGCYEGRYLILTKEAGDELDRLQGSTASLEKSFQRGGIIHLHESQSHPPITRRRTRKAREDIRASIDPTDLEDKVSTTHEVRKVPKPRFVMDDGGGYKRGFQVGK